MHLKSSSSASVDSLGYLNGRWVDASQIALPISDLGVRQAVTAVERLRTYGGKLFAADRHLVRFAFTTKSLGIQSLPTSDDLRKVADELLKRNEEMRQRLGDVGLTIIATPGANASEIRNASPTLVMHLNVIDHDRLLLRRRNGQRIVITDVVQPPSESWSRQLKVRCRLHYFLADQLAREIDSDATGLLIDSDGTVTESSIASLAIVESGRIVSPPKPQVLGGVTQSLVEEIARDQGLDWIYRRLTRQAVLQADEILLMGTDGGIWWGRDSQSQAGDETEGSSSAAGPIYRQLRERFDRIVTS